MHFTGERAPLIAEPPEPSAAATPPGPPEPSSQAPVGVERLPPRLWALAPPGPGVKWRWTIGLDGIALLGFGLPPALGGSAFAELGPSGKWYVRPGFRLGFAYAITVPWTNDAGVGARWQCLIGHAEACPLRFAPDEVDLHVGLCAAVDAGAILSKGQYLAHPRSETRLWAAPGILARLSWGLPAGVRFEIAGGLSWPVRQWRYTYQTYTGEGSLSELSGPGETFSLGLGYRFP